MVVCIGGVTERVHFEAEAGTVRRIDLESYFPAEAILSRAIARKEEKETRRQREW
jgi:hypothetical protein